MNWDVDINLILIIFILIGVDRSKQLNRAVNERALIAELIGGNRFFVIRQNTDRSSARPTGSCIENA